MFHVKQLGEILAYFAFFNLSFVIINRFRFKRPLDSLFAIGTFIGAWKLAKRFQTRFLPVRAAFEAMIETWITMP